MSWSINDIPIKVITLSRRQDRWNKMTQQPGFDILKPEKWEGVDGQTLDIMNDSRVSIQTRRNILKRERRSHDELDSPGGVGCALSHIQLWQWFLQQSHSEVMMVLEDDAVLPLHLKSQINDLQTKNSLFANSNNWDVWICAKNIRKSEPIDSNCGFVTDYMGNQAYFITKKGAKKLLEVVYPISFHIDRFEALCCEMGIIKVFHDNRLIVKQMNVTKSDIAMRGCRICNVPTNFSDDFVLEKKWRHTQLRIEEILLATLLISGIYLYVSKKRK